MGVDDTIYTLANLREAPLDSGKAEGEHVRSFQLAIAKLAGRPGSARFKVHQPGPLNDAPAELVAYEQVFVRGLQEVGTLLAGVVARPL